MMLRFILLLLLCVPQGLLAQFLPIPKGQSHRIGLFIGTFDPPHRDHAFVVKAALEQGLVDYVLVIPNENGIHKPHATDFKLRHQMSEVYFANIPGAFVPDISFNLNNHYLPNILNHVTSHYSESQLFGVIGTDLAKKIPRIYHEELHWMGLLSAFYVHSRPGYQDSEVVTEYQNKALLFFDAPGEGLSSSYIRQELAKGSEASIPLEQVLSTDVLQIILNHGLWGLDSSCSSVLVKK